MNRNGQRILLAAVAFLAAGVGAAQTCEEYFVLDAGDPQASEPARVHGGKNPLTLPSGITTPSSMTMTTVPDYDDWAFTFISHAENVHMIHYASTGPEHTFDLQADGGLNGTLILTDVSAAKPVYLNTDEAQYALYVVGYHVQGWDPPKPYFFVLDQEAMLMRFETTEELDPYILDHGYLCVGPSCAGLAAEIQVYSRTGNAEHQEAYIQTMEFTVNPYEQRILRLTRNASPGGNWQVSIAKDLEPGQFDFPNMGFAWDRVSDTPYAAVGGQILDLDADQLGCKFGDIVSDLSIWSVREDFFSQFTNSSYTFATVQMNAGTSKLVGFPTGTCPDFNLPSSISIPVAHEAIKTLMYQENETKFWIRVLSTDNTVTTIELEISPGGGTAEDTLSVLSQTTVSIGESAVDIGSKPINLCGCKDRRSSEKDNVVYCYDLCSVNENGERMCYTGIRGGTDPQPSGCVDPEDPACRTPVGNGPVKP